MGRLRSATGAAATAHCVSLHSCAPSRPNRSDTPPGRRRRPRAVGAVGLGGGGRGRFTRSNASPSSSRCGCVGSPWAPRAAPLQSRSSGATSGSSAPILCRSPIETPPRPPPPPPRIPPQIPHRPPHRLPLPPQTRSSHAWRRSMCTGAGCASSTTRLRGYSRRRSPRTRRTRLPSPLAPPSPVVRSRTSTKLPRAARSPVGARARCSRQAMGWSSAAR